MIKRAIDQPRTEGINRHFVVIAAFQAFTRNVLKEPLLTGKNAPSARYRENRPGSITATHPPQSNDDKSWLDRSGIKDKFRSRSTSPKSQTCHEAESESSGSNLQLISETTELPNDQCSRFGLQLNRL